jgi:hypothetical protein
MSGELLDVRTVQLQGIRGHIKLRDVGFGQLYEVSDIASDIS